MEAQLLSLYSDPEIELEKFRFPVILKNKLLMAPGKHNGVDYTGKEIKAAFLSTDWEDKFVKSLILDHADKPLSMRNWIGYVEKPRMNGDELYADLALYDTDAVIKLVKAKAKFGISPKIEGNLDSGNLTDFTFKNFSVVVNPAIGQKAYINLQKDLKGGFEMAEEKVSTGAKELGIENKEEELKKKKKEEYPEETICDEELETITTNSDWTDFVKKMKAKDPKMSFQAIAKAYKGTQKDKSELESLSEEEILERINQLTEILKKKKKEYPYPEEEDMKKKKYPYPENKKLEELNKKIEELNSRFNEPDRKTVELGEIQELRSGISMAPQASDGVKSFALWLQNNVGKRTGQIF